MRKITADLILLPDGQLHKGMVLVFSEDGRLNSIQDSTTDESIEFYKGIITPGFVNAHCHLELSYMKGAIPQHNGLAGFIEDLLKVRAQAQPLTISEPIAAAAKEMWESGIQVTGDICNTADTIATKNSSKIHWVNFVELYGLNEAHAVESYRSGLELVKKFKENQLEAFIVPHAPYSVAPALLNIIATQHPDTATWSIHNQESHAEKQLFENKSGPIAELFEKMGISLAHLPAGLKSSLEYTATGFPEKGNILLVHDTFTTPSDLDLLRAADKLQTTWYVLCPKANLYIEERLPDLNLLRQNKCNIAIGTDSLASNNTLSMLEEIQTLFQHFPNIPVNEMLTYATASGAAALGLNNKGKFERGVDAGCVWISSDGDPANSGSWQTVKRLI